MHILYDDIVEDWEKRFSHVCYHSKKLSIAIWALSSTITSPATLHFSRISWVCGGDFYTSHQNSFAKDCSKSNKLQETHCKGFLCLCISHRQKLCHHTIGVINNTLPGTTTFHSAIFKNPQVCSGDFCTAKDLLEEQAIIAIMWIDKAIAFVPFLRSFLFLQRSYWWLKPCVLEAHVKTHFASFDARYKNMLIECSVTKLRMVLICVWWIIVIQALQHGIATSSLCK